MNISKLFFADFSCINIRQEVHNEIETAVQFDKKFSRESAIYL